MKKTRITNNELLLAEKAARNFRPMLAPDIHNWQISAFSDGYKQALLDLQDGKITLPDPVYR